MNSVLTRANRNFFLRHPWQLVLAIIGIALGVAVVVSIDLARISADYAFDRSTSAIVGKASHRIVGGPAGVDESLYTRLRVEEGLHLLAPLVQGHVTVNILDSPETLTVLGIDPFAETAFRNYTGPGTAADNSVSGLPPALLTRANSVLLDSRSAARLGVGAGDELDILSGSRQDRVQILQLVKSEQSSSVYSLDNLMLADIATAQELLGMIGRLSHIDILIADDVNSAAQIERIESLLPPGVELLATAARNQSLGQMTRAFHTNLTALSLLALLVGMFLVYNTMTFMVLQRRPLFGILRGLGVSREQLFRVILNEALIIGVIATVLGILGGIVLGKILLQLVNRTINDLYFLLPVTELRLSSLTWLKGLLLGLVATIVAALLPAREAASVTPRQAMSRSDLENRSRAIVRRSALGGVLLMLCGATIIAATTKSIVAGFAGIFAIILGCTLLTPLLTVSLTSLLAPLMKRLFGSVGKMTARSIVAGLSRTAVAVGALMVAFATVVGIGLMIDSFRLSVDRWLQMNLRADLYIATPGEASQGAHHRLDRQLAGRIRGLAEVEEVSSIRLLQIESSQGLTRLAAYEFTDKAWSGFRFKESAGKDIRAALEDSDTVIVSEPYAYRNDIRPGSSLQLRSDEGYREFRVAAVYYDYRSERGIVAMSRQTYDRHWHDDSYSGIGVFVKAGTDIDSLRERIRALAPGQSLWIENRSRILRESMDIFDQTFAITGILRVLAAIIAFLGLFSALMALQLERLREFGIYRALGFLPSQLWLMVISETGVLGLLAGLLALPLGCLITALLVLVINRRSFGWSMELHFSAEILAQGLLLAIAAALLAGIYPALKMSQTRAAEALRAE